MRAALPARLPVGDLTKRRAAAGHPRDRSNRAPSRCAWVR